MDQLDEGKADIVGAIEGLNRLSVSLNEQIGTIDSALEELPSALQTLDQQRDDLVRMLQALNRLGDVGVRVIRASKDATIESVAQLVPVLTSSRTPATHFVNAFHVFLTYPFVDEVVGRDPQVARNLHMGDYTNLSITLEVDVRGRRRRRRRPIPTDLPARHHRPDRVSTSVDASRSGDLTSRPCRKVLADRQQLAKLQEECAKSRNRNKDVCRRATSPALPAACPACGSERCPACGGIDGILGGALPRARPSAGRRHGAAGPDHG